MTDRLIQIVALVVIVAGLAATLLLTPNINRQRIDRQLTYDTVAGDGSNPQYTLLASTGAFRGIAVNMAWYRIEELKNKGKFAEANNLARLIVSLQPRFPGAWEFMAWNMAYNISVQCNTAEERWYWVNNGLELVRSEGVPNNPRSIQLYRQLSWILSHKMGGRTDDMHWYYKREFAQEWETVLYQPMRDRFPKREGDEPLIAQSGWHELMPNEFDWAANSQFRDINNIAQAYLRTEAGGESEWSTDHYNSVLTPEVMAKFYEDHPGTERVVAQLETLKGPAGEDLGLGLNAKTLMAFGYLRMLQRAGYNINDPALREPNGMSAEAQAVLDYLNEQGQNPEPTPDNPFIAIVTQPRDGRSDLLQNRELYRMSPPGSAQQFLADFANPLFLDLSPLLDLLRAQALIADYHMDPAYMMWLMDEYGPIDWRHVNSHALYWSSLGTIMARDNNNRSRIDFINNDRQTLHAIQGLAYQGTLVFRPRVPALGQMGRGVIQTSVDVRFFEAYRTALQRTQQLIDDGEFGNVKEDTYNTGYENFMHFAIMSSYYGGQTGLADYYYTMVKEEFGQPGSRSPYIAEYELFDLPTFSFERLMADDLFDSKTAYLRQLLDRAWREGLIQGDTKITERYLSAAQQFFDRIQEDYNSSPATGGTGTQDRMNLADFREWIIESFINVLTDPGYSIQERASFWIDAARLLPNITMVYEVYLRMSGPLAAQMEMQGIAVEFPQVFSRPQGFDAWYAEQLRQQEREQDNNNEPGLSTN